MSYKSDIFSLGIVITELVSGDKGIPDNNKNNVLRRWRHRWKKSGKETPLAYQQVAKCMEIGLLCQEIDPAKRPFIWDMIHDIREVDSANGTISNACEYTFGQISPYSEDDMLGVEPLELHFPFDLNKKISCSLMLTNQTDAYIAFNIQNMSPLPYCTQPNKGIVPPRSKRSVDVSLNPQDKSPRDMERTDEFIVWSTKVNDGLTDNDITINMFSTESGVVDAMNLDVVFDAEESTKCTDKLLVQNTIASKDLAPQIVTGEMFMNKTDGKVATDKTKFDESFSPKPTLLESSTSYQNYQEGESSTSNQNCQEGAQAFSEPQSARYTATETEIIPGSSIILDVHPLELCFHFEPNKLIACSLDLTNNTDEKLAFGLLKKSDKNTFFLSRLPMFGVVDPRTTYTLVLIMDKHKSLPRERNIELILRTSANCNSLSDRDETFMLHFQNAEQLGISVHQVTLKGVCALQEETIFEQSIPSSIKIISMEYFQNSRIATVDVNQTEPLIITGYYSGDVHIWNYDTEKYIDSIKIQAGVVGTLYDLFCDPMACSVKFIARKGWFVVGSNDGFIHVYDYKNKMQKNMSFKADGVVRELAIHPTKSYVLSISTSDIKLWDWDHWLFSWKHMQTFNDSDGASTSGIMLCAVAFNPEDHNGFASASTDGTIKVWSLDSPKSEYTLSGHSGWLRSLDFFTRGGQQYLISGSDDETAKIWDMKKKECVHTLPHQSSVTSVLPHPKLPLLVTGTRDGTVYLWSSTDFRLKRILNIDDGLYWVMGLACLNESGRFVVAHKNGLSVIEISDEEEQGGCSSNNENSVSAAD